MNVHKHERLMINVHGFSLLSPCISNGLHVEQVSQQLTRNPFIRSLAIKNTQNLLTCITNTPK